MPSWRARRFRSTSSVLENLRAAGVHNAAMRSVLVAACLLLVLVNAEPARTQAQFSFDWPAVASRLVAQLAPRPGEKILILAHPGMFEALIPHLRYAIARAGATDVGVVDVLAEPVPQGWDLDAIAAATLAHARPTARCSRAWTPRSCFPERTPASPRTRPFRTSSRDGKSGPDHPLPLGRERQGLSPSRPPAALSRGDRCTCISARSSRPTTGARPRAQAEASNGALRTGEVQCDDTGRNRSPVPYRHRPVNLQDGNASPARASEGAVLIDRETSRCPRAPSAWLRSKRPSGELSSFLLRSGRAGTSTAASPIRARKDRLDMLGRGHERSRKREIEGAGEAGRSFREFALGLNPFSRCRTSAVDSVLRLWRGRRPAVARRQQRARRQGDRRIRALELLHRRHGIGERRDLGRRTAS